MSRQELLATHNAEQIAEWQAFDLLEPFGGDATDLRFARLTAILANAYRAADVSPYTVEQMLIGQSPELAEDQLEEKILRTFGVS